MKLFSLLTLFLLILPLSYVFSQNELNDSIRAEILAQHNRHRQVVGSPNLEWSAELENSAQNFANSMAQDPRIKQSKSGYGENIYWGEIDCTMEQMVQSWAKEGTYYYGKPLTDKELLRYQHYTQIIWAETTQIGCAIAISKSNREIWVCHYNPKGNKIGEKPYKK